MTRWSPASRTRRRALGDGRRPLGQPRRAQLSGPRVRELLAAGCALDLHPRAFGPNRCAQTLLARAHVILERDGDAFRLFVRPSFARYLAGWLLDVLEGLAADEAP